MTGKKMIFGLAALGLVLALLAAPLIALADNVVNDVAADVYLTLPGSSTVNYKVVATSTAGDVSSCNVDGANPATVTIVKPPAVTATPASLTFTACGVYQSVVFTASAGDYAISVSVSGGKTGSAWNTAPAAFTLHVSAPADTTAPTVQCSVPDQAIWYGTNVTVNCTASDSGSGLANEADASFTLSTSVNNGTETSSAATGSRDVCDKAGNCVTVGPYTFKVDRKAPTFNGCPAGGPFILNSGAQAVGPISAADGGSGLDAAASALSGSVDTSSVGEKNVTFTAVDNVGNSASKTCSYQVIYVFLGFFPPVNNLPTINAAKAGSAIPVKWALQDATGNFVSDLASFTSLGSGAYACNAAAPEDVIEETAGATGGTVLRYDTTANQFIYNWATLTSWAGSCRRLVLTLNDGTKHYADFRFR